MIKKGIAVILGSFFLLNVLASSRLQKDEAGNQGIHTTLVASRESILPFESVSVMLVLVNETAEDKRVVASWCSFLRIGKITASGTNWRGYRADNEPFLKPCLPTPKSLAPNESKDVPAHIDYEGNSGEHVFTYPGKYLLKGGTTDGTFVSDKIQITVRSPEGVDAKAY